MIQMDGLRVCKNGPAFYTPVGQARKMKNVFVEPDEQSQACLSFAMARTFVQVRAEDKLARIMPNAAESLKEKRTF